MKHRKKGKKLGRSAKQRSALFKSLISSLIEHGRIKTTLAKGKAVQKIAEKLVTKAKEGSNSAMGQVSSFLTRKKTVNKLVNVIAPRFKDKIGGYSRVIRIRRRKGDLSEEVILEWSLPEEKKDKPKRSKIEKKTSKKRSAKQSKKRSKSTKKKK